MDKAYKEILFIINPNSGTSQEKNYPKQISQVSEKIKFSWEIYATTGKNDTPKIRELIKVIQPKTVVAIGGDGTINLVASLLIRTRIALAIIPGGSANGLAYNLNITENFEQEILKILKSEPKTMDAIEINGNYCFHLSDIGINARIIKRFEQEGVRGLGGYAKQTFKEIVSKKTVFSVYLETPEYKKRTKAEMIVLANATSFGTGAIINPTGKLNDGKFEIVVIKPHSWWELFSFGVKIFSGNIQTMNHVKVISTDKVKLKLKRPQAFQIDGEVMENITSLEARIISNSLKVIYR